MTIIKRLISLGLAATFLVSATACGDKSATTTDTTAVTNTATDGEIDIDTVDFSQYNYISIEDYRDRTLAGHIAQYVGFLSGYEFARDSSGNPRIGMPDSWFEICNGPYAEHNPRNVHSDKLLKNEETGLWEVWNDDDFSIDILNQYIIADMYEDYGTFTTKSIKDGWLEYDVYDMGGGHRSNGAYGLFKGRDYLPTYVGMREYGNLYGVNGEPYIANETLGMACAGMPGVAADVTDVFARVTSDMDPVLWARFFSCMYAMAYFESDIPTLIEEARKTLPEGCVVDQVIDEIYALRKKYPTLSQWREAAKEADKICYRHHFEHDSRMGETSINCSYILIGLLWGEGDFYETLRIISLAGHGGDSTTPVGVGIVAVINGFDCIPDEALAKTWQDGEGVVVNLPIKDQKKDYWMLALGLPERIKMADVVDMYQANFEKILKENGGFIYEGHYFIPKTEIQAPVTETLLYEDFEHGRLSAVQSFGSVSMASSAETYMGEYGIKVTGAENSPGGAYITVDGLKVGSAYRYSAYVYTATKVPVYMFARDIGDTSIGQHVNVYGTETCVYRELVFEATSEKMEIGVYMPAGVASHKYAVIDDMCVMRVTEEKVADVSIAGDDNAERKGTFSVSIDGKVKKEAMLKVTFANKTGKFIKADMTVNGQAYGAVPFYKTDPADASYGLDCVYVPVVLTGDTSTLTFAWSERDSLYIFDAELVTVTDRYR